MSKRRKYSAEFKREAVQMVTVPAYRKHPATTLHPTARDIFHRIDVDCAGARIISTSFALN